MEDGVRIVLYIRWYTKGQLVLHMYARPKRCGSQW